MRSVAGSAPSTSTVNRATAREMAITRSTRHSTRPPSHRTAARRRNGSVLWRDEIRRVPGTRSAAAWPWRSAWMRWVWTIAGRSARRRRVSSRRVAGSREIRIDTRSLAMPAAVRWARNPLVLASEPSTSMCTANPRAASPGKQVQEVVLGTRNATHLAHVDNARRRHLAVPRTLGPGRRARTSSTSRMSAAMRWA